jgi:hypothetical protein
MSIDLLQSVGGQVALPRNQTLNVKPLSLADIVVLTKSHYTDLVSIFNAYTSSEESTDADLVESMGDKFPALAESVIVLCIDIEATPEQKSEFAKKLPATAQLDILREAAELTFYTEDSLKKCISTVIQAMEAVTREMQSLTATTTSSQD